MAVVINGTTGIDTIQDGTVSTTKIVADAVTTPKIAGTVNLGRRNLVINGAMQVWQRATSATTAVNNYQSVDRFRTNIGGAGVYTTERSTDTPTGTGYSLKAQVTTADTSIAAGDYAYLHQDIEAQNLQQLLYGTSSAKNIILSFWVKSNKTGTYTIVVRKLSNTSYHLVHEYTINSANTWEKKEIVISPTAGSTSFLNASAGAIENSNARGMQIGFNLTFGSTYNGATNNTWTSTTAHYATTNQVNWLDSTSNNFYLTEVQLEVGDTATPFEHRSFQEELLLCKRYYQKSYEYGDVPGSGNGAGMYLAQRFNTTDRYFPLGPQFPSELRTTPTLTIYDRNGNTSRINQYNGAATQQTISSISGTDSKTIARYLDNNTGAGSDSSQEFHWTADAEL